MAPVILLASHCPEVDTRWTHEYGNVLLRLWSWKHRDIREDILSHRMTAGGVFQASAATSGAVAKSLACQKIARRPCEGLFSCLIRVSILPFVRPSWGHIVRSCHLRLYFVWSSVPSGIFRLAKTIRRKHEGNTKLPDCLRKATRLRDALVIPACSHRIIVRWHRDGTTWT